MVPHFRAGVEGPDSFRSVNWESTGRSDLKREVCHMEMLNGPAYILHSLAFISSGFEHDPFKAR